MARDIEARLKLTAVDRTQKAFNSVSKNLDRIDRKTAQIERQNSLVGRAERGMAAYGRATVAALAPAAVAYGSAQAVVRFASVERAVNRIGITADATAAQTKSAFAVIDKAAFDYAMTQDQVTAGLDSLVAAGRDLPSALSFLPSVTATAQAAGAEIVDMATTADALGNSFGITGDKMQGAFDILVKAGKAGKFELKDMARFVPTLAPAFEVLGYRGEEGVMKLAAALQIVRQRTGSSEEAATSFANVLQKMETEETANKFSKFGIDIRAEMQKARDEGADLLDVFVRLAKEAVDGDLSKLPQLFGDQQVLVGIRALIAGGDDLGKMFERLGDAAGETGKDLARVLDDSQAKIDRMGASWDTLVKNVGSGVATVASPVMEFINDDVERSNARAKGYDAARVGDQSDRDINNDFYKRYQQIYPETMTGDFFNPLSQFNADRQTAIERLGRGEAGSIYDELDRIARSRQGGRFPSAEQSTPRAEAWGQIAKPIPRNVAIDATAVMSPAEQRASYGRGRVAGEKRTIAARAQPAIDERDFDPWISAPSMGIRVGPWTSSDAQAQAADRRWKQITEEYQLRPQTSVIRDEKSESTVRGESPAMTLGSVTAEADALRQALDEGAQSVGKGGQDAKLALDQAGLQLPDLGSQAGQRLAAAVIAALTGNMTQLGAQIASGFNANARAPAAPAAGRLPQASGNMGQSNPNAGVAGVP